MKLILKQSILFIAILTQCGVVHANEDDIDQETSVYSALSMGTGWALTHRHVVTNYHVIDGMKNLRLVLNGEREIPVKIVLSDKKNDLAVLFILDNSIQINPLPLALTKPRLGSQVFTIGFPHPNLMGTSPKLTSGLINATNGLADDPRTLQVSVPVQSGNSGGPLLNMRGEVVGVITSKLSAQKMFEWTGDIPQNVNYAIKINQLSSLISELETDEKVMAGASAKNQSLEMLAEKVVESVIIVAGDGDKNSKVRQNAFLSHGKQADLTETKKNSRVAMYSYAEPEGFYTGDAKLGVDDTVNSYSRTVLNVIKQQLQKHLKGETVFISSSGSDSKDMYDALGNLKYRKLQCDKIKANNIIATYSEDSSGVGSHFRIIYFRMIDCLTFKEYRKEYTIERDELNDRFEYEVALHTAFKDFVLKTPPYVSWQNQ